MLQELRCGFPEEGSTAILHGSAEGGWARL
jgi:hypothetical protein